MKIAVCFKTIADYARLSETDWAWDARHVVDTSFVRRVFNCFDESALEMALKLAATSQNASDPAELTALTVDDRQSDLFLKHLTAVGYHHVVRIQCNKRIDLRFNSLAISDLISTYIKREGHQLVFLGTQGGDGDNRQTGFLVAERLGWPCIREVTAVVMAGSSDRLKVTSRINGATLVQTVKLPMVLIAGHCLDSPYLRIPTLKQKLKAKKNQVTILSNTELGLGNDTLVNNGNTLIDLQRPPVDRSCVFLEGNNAREQAKRLYDEYLKKVFTL
jgi:electron transfer flavoprotein alpha/beta subunit